MAALRTLLSFVLAATAMAFAPAGRMATSSMKMAFANGLPGNAGPELKDFDPLKFAEKSPEWTNFFREAEIKHCRIAMLATAGWIVADLTPTILGVSSFEAHAASVAQGGLLQVLIWVSLLEHINIVAIKDKSRAPGVFAFDPLGLGKKDWQKMEVSELKNGRLAMLAFSGIVTQSALGHPNFPYF